MHVSGCWQFSSFSSGECSPLLSDGNDSEEALITVDKSSLRLRINFGFLRRSGSRRWHRCRT
ncbi:hypothetical protein TcasGA2_TC033024 [Tribolium castaneum]|uniref:Uncharacterized protein n=1 Tax=Tribolium castaneum TaxID=7070 RepID=A0A139WHV6_TRICA|nr:hypothetical protein TcasGA2_TC033024 [Tribolium castaneum]